jgi:2-polyprenyl-3-methyl-5-hydroxy-6-metoxy-1,4-benzoquinol methylase
VLRPWLYAARGRRHAQRVVKPLGPVERLIETYAPGRSFVDVGALWAIHGRMAFLAEDAGATSVTAMDLQPATPEFETERERRGSSVRFVQGDLHDPSVLEQVGPHDVVWCSGVLYHCPKPIETFERLLTITREYLIMITATIPEVPGIPQASVFFPALPERARNAYFAAFAGAMGTKTGQVGLSEPFDVSQGYANWWWGLAPSAVEAMIKIAGFEIVESGTNGFHTRVVGRLRSA